MLNPIRNSLKIDNKNLEEMPWNLLENQNLVYVKNDMSMKNEVNQNLNFMTDSSHNIKQNFMFRQFSQNIKLLTLLLKRWQKDLYQGQLFLWRDFIQNLFISYYNSIDTKFVEMDKISTFLLLLCVTSTIASVVEINSDQFTDIMGINLNQLSNSFKPSREYFILFYAPQIQSSLDVRQLFHRVGEEYERKFIQQLKKKGITQFEEFQQNMRKGLLLAEVDCGQNQNICSEFRAEAYPTFLYISRQGTILEYQGWTNAQQIYNFLMRTQHQKINSRALKPHQISVSGLQKISNFLKNDKFIYLIVFVAAPFLFGYFTMAKPKDQSKDSQSKQLKKEKKAEPKTLETQKQNKNK